jgi:hypothetical protein
MEARRDNSKEGMKEKFCEIRNGGGSFTTAHSNHPS